MSVCSFTSTSTSSTRTGRSSFNTISARLQRATNQHTRSELDELWSYDLTALSQKDRQYFEECKNDLRIVLLVYRGARVRDVKSIFYSHAKYNINLARLKLKNWAHFLIVVGGMLEYKLEMKSDVDREVLYVFLSESGLMAIHKATKDMQCLINTTPDKDGTTPSQNTMITISATEAYLKGFLDAADGRARTDPRVPMQDMGVAATETLRKIRTTKMTFEEQIALTNKRKDPLVTVESTGPLTQDGSLDNFFSWMCDPTATQAATDSSVILKPLGKFDE